MDAVLKRFNARRCLGALLLACLASLASAQSSVQASGSDAAYQIKAAFLYKFLGFIEWPTRAFETADSPLTIGVVGGNSMADELAQIVATRPVNGRNVLIRRLHGGDLTTGLQVLFVGREDSEQLPHLLAAAKNQPLLIISESDLAFTQGSAINFVIADDKVHFDVALYRAEAAGLKISARLLTVARRVLSAPS